MPQLQHPPQSLSVWQPLLGRGAATVVDQRVQLVVGVAREDVQVIMPYVLVAIRLVVLARGHAVAVISLFERHRDALCGGMDRGSIFDWKIEDVFVVRIGHDDHMPHVVWPPARRYKCRYQLVAQHHVPLHGPHVLVFYAGYNQAERAYVAGRRVVVHAGFMARDLRPGSKWKVPHVALRAPCCLTQQCLHIGSRILRAQAAAGGTPPSGVQPS